MEIESDEEVVKIYERWQDRWRFGKLKPLDHYCVHRVLENAERISYMMATKPRADPWNSKERISCEFIKCPRWWESFTSTTDANTPESAVPSLSDVHDREGQAALRHAGHWARSLEG